MIASALLALALAASPPVPPADIHVAQGRLTTRAGAPLYVFAHDTMVGMSHCTGACARDFPPLLASPGAAPSGPWTLVEREDGTRQWAYRDKPLYTAAQPVPTGADSLWGPALAQDAPAAAAAADGPTPPGASAFACAGDRRLLLSFTRQGQTPVALVDVGRGPAALPLAPFTGGEPRITWSDGRRTLVWRTGVKLTFSDGDGDLACGRLEHHH